MNPLITAKGVYAPYVWKLDQINMFFRLLSFKRFAKDPMDLDGLISSSFEHSVKRLGSERCPLERCPSVYEEGSFMRADFGVRLVCTTKEIFIVGENGALEVRRVPELDLLWGAIKKAKDIKKALFCYQVCYAKAGDNGGDAWGRIMLVPGYAPIENPQ
ncbi:MAG: hypothetical protein JWM20_917 [Patescibacteria group bacterium]|nr:hypothetical protein [Patescibacteria group bacterium]